MLFKSKKVTIAAHDGTFHADDIFAIAALSLFLKDTTINVVRSRNPEYLAKADYVVDVGGVYDPSNKRFDHHQTGGAGKRENGIPYAGFGLIWKEYGEHIAGSKRIADMIDQRLVQPVDAIDNGVAITNQIFPNVRPYDISSVIAGMNRASNENDYDEAIYFSAIELARKIIWREIINSQALVNAETYVLDRYKSAEDKRIIVLDQHVPWEMVLMQLPEPLFVVFPKENDWRLRAIRSSTNNFENRKNLPAAWAGKMNADLVALTGVPDALFCHNALFLASARSKEGALKLAKIALEA